ncbi:hypothetical protein BD779DRAFT_1785271 [Infundibulicybe gibba]|nr:hypothetical protein BD779DRAFT_1785271 [Infundibulicybe gibba]
MSQSTQVESPHNPRTFMPKGKRYTQADYGRIRKLFPITYGDIPRCLVDPRALPGYIPPMVFLGWYIPEHSEGVVNLAKKHFGDLLKFENGYPMSDGFIFTGIPDFIRKHYQVPEEECDRVDIVDITMRETDDGIGIVIGDNMKGWLHEDLVERISNDLFNGQQPVWYLNPDAWQVTRPRRF